MSALPLDAFPFNCTTPAAIERGIIELRPLIDKAIGGCCGIGSDYILALSTHVATSAQ